MSSRRARNRGDRKVTEERYPARVFVNIYRRNFASEMFNVLMRESKVVCCFDAAVSEWHVTSRAVCFENRVRCCFRVADRLGCLSPTTQRRKHSESSTRSSGQPRRPFRTQCPWRRVVVPALRDQSSKIDVRSRCAFVV
jgi:hypothetical protein